MKLSVVYDIPRLDIPYTLKTSFQSSHLVSDNEIFTNNDYASIILNVGDVVKLGPSTHSDNFGAVEYVTVKQKYSLYDNWLGFYTVNNTVYKYNQDDPIEAVGTGIPDGWSVDYYIDIATDAPISTSGILSRDQSASNKILVPAPGDRGFYCPKFWHDQSTMGTGKYWNFYYKFPKNLVTGVVHRIGAWYNCKYTGSVGPSLSLLQNSGEGSIASFQFTNSISDYFTTALTSSAGPSQDQHDHTPMIMVLFYPLYYSIDTVCKVGFIFVSHATGTSGEAAGAYTIPYTPMSIKSQKLDLSSMSVSRYNPQKMQIADTGGRRLPKQWDFSFEATDEDFIRNLDTLLRWQDLGWKLMLEPEVDPNGDPGYDIEIGYMTYSIGYDFWDLTRPNVYLTFRGE